jgi:hypothetical protein
LPQRREHSQIVELLALLAAKRLSDLLETGDRQGHLPRRQAPLAVLQRS